MTAGFLVLQTTVLSSGGDSPSDAATTQLAAAGTREDDGGATRGAPRSDASDLAVQLTTAAESGLGSPADEPNPGPTPEEVAAAEANKKLEAEAVAKKAAEEEAARKKAAEDAAAKRAAEAKAQEAQAAERSESPAASRSAPSSSGSGIDAQLDRLAQCESGGNYAINTGNGFYGAYQFNLSTWRANGGSGYPHQASPDEQRRVAKNLQASRGWQPWPACSKKLGLR